MSKVSLNLNNIDIGDNNIEEDENELLTVEEPGDQNIQETQYQGDDEQFESYNQRWNQRQHPDQSNGYNQRKFQNMGYTNYQQYSMGNNHYNPNFGMGHQGFNNGYYRRNNVSYHYDRNQYHRPQKRGQQDYQHQRKYGNRRYNAHPQDQPWVTQRVFVQEETNNLDEDIKPKDKSEDVSVKKEEEDDIVY